MNKRIPGIAVISLGLLVATGATVSAQQPAHTETTIKTTGAGPNTKSKTESVTGTVKDYEAGKKIKIEGPGGKDYSFDLDENAHVKGSIVVGQKAKVSYSKSADGVEKVTVLSEAGPGASSGAAMGTEGTRMHTESTVKHTGEGPNTKTKKEIVVGTVKSFEPGKKIKVTGPGDKDFSFDLDEASGVQGNISIGERVKVTYTKTDNGDKVTTVQPYHGK
jgi:ABC-type glycerol-3-phosphate transport system substrate-binding protein